MFEVLIALSISFYLVIGFSLGKMMSANRTGIAAKLEFVFWFILWPTVLFLTVLVTPALKEKR